MEIWRGRLVAWWPGGLPSWPMSERAACKLIVLIGQILRYPALPPYHPGSAFIPIYIDSYVGHRLFLFFPSSISV